MGIWIEWHGQAKKRCSNILRVSSISGVHPKMRQSVKLQLFGPPILARIQPVVDSPAMNVTVFDYRAYR